MVELSESTKNTIKERLFISPLLVLKDCVDDINILNYCNTFLPYSAGIEIEANLVSDGLGNLSNLKFSCLDKDIGYSEQTFRIPNGYKGLLCLELFSFYLKKYQINTDSGNHYHIDCTDNYDLLFNKIKIEKKFVIEELEKWGTNDNINRKEIGYNTKFTYCNLRTSFKTAEFRIGELTCEFPLLLKRILSCTNIIKTIRQKYNLEYEIRYDNDININSITKEIDINDNLYIVYCNKKTKKLKNKQKEKKIEQEVSKLILPNKEFIDNKILKFY